MTSPTDRTVRFSLRLAPDEMAVCEDVQDRMGGAGLVSLNTVIALLLVEGYHYRVTAAHWDTLPLPPAGWAYVNECADELGVSSAEALMILIRRGAPHQPQRGCMTSAGRLPGVLPPARLPGPPPHPAGRQEDANGPRYATPRPSGLPPVPTVEGQVPYDADDQGETR